MFVHVNMMQKPVVQNLKRDKREFQFITRAGRRRVEVSALRLFNFFIFARIAL